MITNRFLIFFVSFCLIISKVLPQGKSNLFLVGYNGGGGPLKIDFSSGTPVILTDTRSINANSTNANISDVNGNLLFYTNGIAIGNSLNDTMQNGMGLNPNSFTTSWNAYGLRLTQADIIIPIPLDSSRYYLFHETCSNMNYDNYDCFYSIIDMSLNNNIGGVTQKNLLLLHDTLARGQLTACKHANGRDWWLVIPKYGLPDYFIYLIDPNGITFYSKQTIGTRYFEGQAAFSPNGEHYGSYDAQDDIELFDFDRCTGVFSNYRHVEILDSNYGIGFSFSPNSKLAYASSAHFLYQVNVDSLNLSISLDTVAIWDSTYSPFPPIETGFDIQQLALDGKIYVTTTGSTEFMHYIQFPDSVGTACNVIQHGLFLDSMLNWNTIPNHPNYFLGPVIGSVCDSLGLGIPENASFNFHLTVFPNPAAKDFTINYQLPQNKKGVFDIVNVLGEKVYSLNLPPWSTIQRIHVQKLSQGVYLAKITSGMHSVSKKIVIE